MVINHLLNGMILQAAVTFLAPSLVGGHVTIHLWLRSRELTIRKRAQTHRIARLWSLDDIEILLMAEILH